ncbi:MAG: endonuclease [Flavobacteriales bacterium]|jgi:hypothetical protein|nr:endonuclease [Flavobacteriales bacterium]
MVIKKLLLGTLVCFTLDGLAQTTLPTSFDFATAPATMPTGWTTNSTANYSTGLADLSGGTSRAGKLQSTGHKITINFYDEPGEVSYFLKSYGTASFMGTFRVEESVNGTTWSTLDTYNSNSFDDSWTEYNSTPDPDSRYIRFNLTNKVSGTNVGIDNVEIVQYVGPEQEINAVYESENVPNSSGIQFAEALSSTYEVKLGIENLGTDSTLQLGSITLSGSAMGDYTITSSPSSIPAEDADTITIEFTPTVMGNRPAQISIANNDQNEDPYQINLNGVGGLSASEPGANPGSASTTYLKTWRANGTFDLVTADGYITLMRIGAAVTDIPVDGMSYTLGEGIGNSKVVGVGPNNSFRIRSASAETDYHVSIFAYNGSGTLTNYRTSDPLEDIVSTPVASMDDAQYWNGIDETSSSFVDDLNDLINSHSVRFYSNYDEDMVPGFLARDTGSGQEVITGVYSTENAIYSPPFDWSSTNTNREHTLPASWMPSAGNSGTPEYQDYHHLFPTIATTNSQRSNRPLAEVVNVTNSYGGSKAGTDANGNSVYEPRDSQKGDAARAIMYMMTAYDWARSELQSNGPNQNMNVLLDWHFSDMPSPFERSRNDYIDSLQGNRNPFVDSIHWVCYIDFKTMSYKADPDSTCLALSGVVVEQPTDTTDSTISIGQINSDLIWGLYPNPTSDAVVISGFDSYSYRLMNLLGETIQMGSKLRSEPISVSDLAAGSYFIEIVDGEKTYGFKKLVVIDDI